MNQNYNELKQSIEYIKAHFLLDGQWRRGKVQKIYTSGKIICLAVRLPGKTIHLAFGRGDKYCGLYLLEAPIPSEYRVVKDQFLEYFRKHIRGNAIVDIAIDEMDRIAKVTFFDKSELFFFWKGGNLHFSHSFKDGARQFIFSPWESMEKKEVDVADYRIFDQIDRRDIDKRPSRVEPRTISYDEFLDGEKKAGSKILKKLKKKRDFIAKDLEICSRWEELQSLAIKDELDLSQDKFRWKGIKLNLLGIEGHFKRRDKIFDKVKKLKRGYEILEKRLRETEVSLETRDNIKIEQRIIYPIWKIKTVKKKDKITQDNDAVYLNFKDYKIAVGKSARSNDWLRKDWAKKSDTWIHLDDYKSSHLFVKNFDTFNIDDFSVLCSILADYSDFSGDMIPVIFTQVSNLKGVKGVAGTVNYKKEKHLIVQKVNWKEIISTAW